ncbi:MAG TPA: MarR family transcriptional regulator [Spirochaetia bacterium]|nr:MarR family transcriptional regulator [Spirochaetia bacterium]
MAKRPAGYGGAVAAVRGFNRFYTRLLGLLDEKLLASPVSLTEARILWELERNPHSRAEDLLARLSVDRGYMSRILARLERAGLLSRTVHARDGRIRLLDLTLRGHAFLSGLEEKASAQIAGLLEPLAPAQRKRLVQAMAEVEALLSDSRGSQSRNDGG